VVNLPPSVSQTTPSPRSRLRWPRRTLPGLMVIGLVLLGRSLGIFQGLEWKTLDRFLRWRPAESPDPRLLIVGINEADIQRVGQYPVPDGILSDLLRRLQAAGPRVIGVDIFRDIPVEPGHAEWVTLLTHTSNVIGIERITPETITGPPALPPEQVGFIDFPLDQDGFVRRAYLGSLPAATAEDPERFRFSLALRLSEQYLQQEQLSLDNGLRDPANMRFGDTELRRILPHSGGYTSLNPAGIQLFINPRSGPAPFDLVSMTDVLENRIPPTQIQNRVVIVGLTAPSTKDVITSAAVQGQNPGLLFGVEMHAHVTSQILSTVLDGRPMLRVWAGPWEYLWIGMWGLFGMVLIPFWSRPAWYVLTIGLLGLGLAAASWALLWLGGWWIPVVPTLIVFTINGLVLPGFYWYDQTLRSRIDERQRVIEETYDAIHNGPLQTLALLLRDPDPLTPDTSTRLQSLNQELRTIYARLQQESLPQQDQLQLGSQTVVDLRNPLHEVLYEVYSTTLQRDFPGFDGIKIKIVKFDPLQVDRLPHDEKRAICRFLEEALCNIGKHAIGAKRLTVTCTLQGSHNLIRIEDNGQPPATDVQQVGGRGTQQALDLAERLRGTYRRERSNTATRCELRWPSRSVGFWRGWLRL